MKVKVKKKDEEKAEKTLKSIDNSQESSSSKPSYKDMFKTYRIDLIIILVLSMFYFFSQIVLTIPMQQLPSPMYGGDHYYQLGCVNNVKYGGAAFDNCNHLTGNTAYLPMYAFLVGNLASIFNMDSFTMMIVFSQLIIFVSLICMYSLLKMTSKSRMLSIIGVLLFYRFQPAILKYTEFGAYVMMPMLLLAMYLFYKNQSYKNSIILALVLGVASLSHSTLFVSAYAAIAAMFIFILNGKKFNDINFNNIFNRLSELFPKFLIVGLIAVSITMIFWYEPIFIHHSETSSHYLEWNGPGDMSEAGLKMKMLRNMFINLFFKYTNLLFSIFSLLTILSVVGLLFIKKKDFDDTSKFVNYIFVFLLLFVPHYFITYPLLKTHFVPNYIFYVFGSAIVVMFVIYNLSKLISSVIPKSDSYQRVVNFALVFLIILLVIARINMLGDYTNSQWYQVSLTPIDDQRLEMQKFIKENTQINDVFLTTKETGFMLNGLTGRKLVTSRWAQNDPFEEMSIRDMDAATILYGNNTDVKKELVEKYDVKYLYWDYYWIQSEFRFDNQGRLISSFDPMLAFVEPEYIQQLNDNGVIYTIEHSYVDPALRTQFHPTFDLITISPQNYRSYETPWDENLEPYLKKVWSYDSNGQEIAAIYEINFE